MREMWPSFVVREDAEAFAREAARETGQSYALTSDGHGGWYLVPVVYVAEADDLRPALAASLRRAK